MSPELLEKYPHLVFKQNWEITPLMTSLIYESYGYTQALMNTPMYPSKHKELLLVSLIKGAQATTAIEGNSLSEDEIKKVISKQPISKSREYQAIEVKNVVDALNTLLGEVIFQNQVSLITPDLIKRFHRLIGQNLGEHLDASPGHFREDNRIVGYYRCPDYTHVELLITKLCDWLKEEFGFSKSNQTFQDVIIQAIITHVYLEWIHPFGDGNGRTGRLLEFYILLRGGLPDIGSHILFNHYNNTRSEYYKHFDNARTKRDLTEFIEYALIGYRDGLKETLHNVLASQLQITWQKYIYDIFNETKGTDRVSYKRRRRLVLAMALDKRYSLEEISLISPEIARDYATLSTRSVLRDLKELEKMQLIKYEKNEKNYYANIGLLGGYFPHVRMIVN